MRDLIRSPRILAIIAACVVGCGAAAQAQTPTTAPAQRPQADMRAMSTAVRALTGNINDATKNAASLESVAALLKASLAAKGDMPPLVAALPEGERAAKYAAYQKEMNVLIRQELDLEEALLANDNAKAATLLQALNATQMDGHRDFRPARGGGAGRAGRGGAPGGSGAPNGAPAEGRGN